MPIVIPPPRVESKESPREIFAIDFKKLRAKGIRGGWGYTIDDAVIIDKNDPEFPKRKLFDGVGLEYIFVEKRIYAELIILRAHDDTYSGIKWDMQSQELRFANGRRYDLLKFEVTALPTKDWFAFKSEWEGPNGHCSPGFDVDAHNKKKDAKTIQYITEYWFDITSFFG